MGDRSMRRDDGGRVRDPEQWSPPLSTAVRLASSVPRAGIKVGMETITRHEQPVAG